MSAHEASPCSHHAAQSTRHSSGQRQTPSACQSARVASSGGAQPLFTSNQAWALRMASSGVMGRASVAPAAYPRGVTSRAARTAVASLAAVVGLLVPAGVRGRRRHSSAPSSAHGPRCRAHRRPPDGSSTTADETTGTTAATSATGATATTTTPAATTKTIRSPADLEPLLITDVPDGFERQPDDVGETGPSDLSKAAADDGQEGAREFYESHGFVAGYQRLWASGVRPDGSGPARLQSANLIVVFLYAFEDASGAQATMDRLAGFIDKEATPGVEPFEPTGVPGAKGYFGGSDEDGYAAIVVFTRGQFVAQMVVGTREPCRPSSAGLAARSRPVRPPLTQGDPHACLATFDP